DLEIELQSWVDSMNKIESGLILFDKEMFAKYIEKGIESDILAKHFDTFNIEIEKGVDIEVAIEHLVKGVDSTMPGVLQEPFL
ncbi:hypothetical protein ACFL3C_05690, partial [Patescibacteria group bacterium]